MFGVKPYYLSSSGTLDYTEGYTISSVDSSINRFNVEVPLASSIESTMEWCNRVGFKHQWEELNNPIFDASGFYWLQYNGLRELNRVVPSSYEPYQINGRNILGSGFYLRYREIVRFMGDNNLRDWGFPSGSLWPNMEVGNNGYWTDIDNLNVNYPSGTAHAKIEKAHYHQYIYRGTQQVPYWWGGIFYKNANNSVGTDITKNYYSEADGWESQLTSHNSAMSTIAINWSGLPYLYTEPNINYNRAIAGSSPVGFLISLSGNYIAASSINTYYNFITYPDTRMPFAIQQNLNINRTIGFFHTKGGMRKIIKPFGLDFTWIGITVPESGYKYIVGSGHYGSSYSQCLDNSFWAEYYPFHYTVNNGYPELISKKLVHLLGNGNFNYVSSVSGVTTGLDISESGEFWGFREGIRLGGPNHGLPFGVLLPLWDCKTDYSCEDDWTGQFKVVCGFIQMSGSRLITGESVTYGGGDFAEARDIGNKTASKLRNGQYQELFTFNASYPSDLRLGTIFTSPSSINQNINSIYNVYSSGDNVMFLSCFYYPFEGLPIDITPIYDTPVPSPLTEYILPAVADTFGWGPGATTDIIKRERRGELIRFTIPSLPSSILLNNAGRLGYDSEWW